MLVLVAGVILLWPNHTGRVLGILVAVALAVYAVTTAVELARERRRRVFPWCSASARRPVSRPR